MSQADKRRRKPKSPVPVTPPPAQELEVVEVRIGGLTEAQWKDMFVWEEAGEIVGEIMDELMGKCMEGCLKVDIERQLVPFTVSWAKNYLTQILEQQIQCPDEGEGLEEASKTEDSEPRPSTPDSWAQGCVPVVSAAPKPHPATQQVAEVVQAAEEAKPSVNHQVSVMAQANTSPKQSEKKKSPRKPVSDKHCKALSSSSPPKIDKKKNQPSNVPPPTFNPLSQSIKLRPKKYM